MIKDLEVLTRKFWWGYGGDSRKVHWVNWKKLCQAKDVGGMGFKEIEKFNDTLLAKQVCRMINNPDSLYHRVFKVRFFPDCSILEAKKSTTGSMCGRASLMLEMLFKRVWFNALETVKMFRSRRIGGYQ